MVNKYLIYITLFSTLATLNLHAMDLKKTNARLWTPDIKPALYLNVKHVKTEKETYCPHIIDAMSQRGPYSEAFDYHFPHQLKDCKALELSTFLGQNYATQQLIKAALIFATANGKSKIGFERNDSHLDELRQGKFIASIVYVHPNVFHVKVTEDTPKDTQG